MQDHYINSYFNYGKLLFASGDVDKSVMIVKDIIDKYRKNDTKSKLVLVNLLVYQAKCVEAKFYLNSIDLNKLFENSGLLPSLKDYYKNVKTTIQTSIKLLKSWIKTLTLQKLRLMNFNKTRKNMKLMAMITP